MMRSVRSVAFVCALAFALVGVLAACNGKGGGEGRNVTWVLDTAASIKRSDPEQVAWTKQHLQGLSIVLELHGDNSFALTITGGQKPEASTGTYKGGYDSIRLHRMSIDGKPLAAGVDPDWNLPADAAHVEVKVGSLVAVLSKK